MVHVVDNSVGRVVVFRVTIGHFAFEIYQEICRAYLESLGIGLDFVCLQGLSLGVDLLGHDSFLLEGNPQLGSGFKVLSDSIVDRDVVLAQQGAGLAQRIKHVVGLLHPVPNLCQVAHDLEQRFQLGDAIGVCDLNIQLHVHGLDKLCNILRLKLHLFEEVLEELVRPLGNESGERVFELFCVHFEPANRLGGGHLLHLLL